MPEGLALGIKCTVMGLCVQHETPDEDDLNQGSVYLQCVFLLNIWVYLGSYTLIFFWLSRLDSSAKHVLEVDDVFKVLLHI